MEIKQRYFTIVNSLGAVQRNATNPFAKAKYASLSNIQKHLMPLLTEQNCYLHFNFGTFEGDVYRVELRLLTWDTDEVIQWFFAVPIDSSQKNRVQAFGSTTTYAQRYALCVAFQIALDDEDPDAKSNQSVKSDKPHLLPGDQNWVKAVEYITLNGKEGWAAVVKKYQITAADMKKLEIDVERNKK